MIAQQMGGTRCINDHQSLAHQPALATTLDAELASFCSVAPSAPQLPCLVAAKQHCRSSWAADGPRCGVSGSDAKLHLYRICAHAVLRACMCTCHSCGSYMRRADSSSGGAHQPAGGKFLRGRVRQRLCMRLCMRSSCTFHYGSRSCTND